MKKNRGPCREPKIAYKILAYLEEHPKAQDTLEGIVEWWLLEQEIKHRMAEVKRALIDLVAKGLILERRGRDARLHYRINSQKSDKVRTLLKRQFG